MVLQWKDAVGSAETLAVGLSIEILPIIDVCRERWGKCVQQPLGGSDELVEKMRTRNAAKDDREDYV